MSGTVDRRRQRQPVGRRDARAAGCSWSHGDASARCGISLKGADIVVRGSVGHMSAFMAQKGALVVCGDAGDALGDSLYEARLYVRGAVAGLGADCVEKEMRDEHLERARASCSSAPGSTTSHAGGVPPLRLGAAALQLPRRQPRELLMGVRCERRGDGWHPGLRESATFDRDTIAEIQRAAREGIYDIRGFGAKRRVPHFDDLLFLGASVSRYPLEGYRERCATDVDARHALRRASRSQLEIPITIAGMSFGALSAPAKEALGRGATEVGTSTTTGDGGMTEEEREHSRHARLPAAALPLRDEPGRPAPRRRDRGRRRPGRQAGRRRACCSATRSPTASRRCATCRPGSTSAAPAGTPTGPARTTSRSRSRSCARSPTGEMPIFVKVGATRTYYDVALAVKAGADVIVLDGMQGGTAATQEVFIEHVGIPILAAIPQAVEALQELGMHREVQLIVSGGIRTGADVAKALALGADAVSIGVAALIALGDNAPSTTPSTAAIGSAAGFYDDWQAGRDPAGISTQDDRARRAPGPGRGRPAAGELPAHADARGADARARVRQVARPQPRARGPRRADDRGGRDGPRAAGGHGLDPGAHRGRVIVLACRRWRIRRRLVAACVSRRRPTSSA